MRLRGDLEANGYLADLRTLVEDIGQIVVQHTQGVPTYISDVAQVALGQELRTGAATKDGEEVVVGTAFMLMGENSRVVSRRVAERLVEVNRTLPAGILAKPFHSFQDAAHHCFVIA